MLSATSFLLLFCASVYPSSAFSSDAHIKEEFLPVYPGDVDRPYKVVGEIRDNLRKHFAFQSDPTEKKIYEELWERGRKMGADAVIHARYGPTKATLFNNGKTPIAGTAIKFADGVDHSKR